MSGNDSRGTNSGIGNGQKNIPSGLLMERGILNSSSSMEVVLGVLGDLEGVLRLGEMTVSLKPLGLPPKECLTGTPIDNFPGVTTAGVAIEIFSFGVVALGVVAFLSTLKKCLMGVVTTVGGLGNLRGVVEVSFLQEWLVCLEE